MSAEDSNSEVVDATNPQHFSTDIPWSELQDQDSPKKYASRKYQKNSFEKKLKNKLRSNLDKQYEDLVSDIQRLRLNKKNPEKQVNALEKLKKKQKKQLKKIAQCQSLGDVRKYGCALLDGLHAMIKYMETVREIVGEETLKFLLDLFTTLYNVYHNPDWATMSLNFASFFSRHFPTEYADYALCWLKAAFEVAFTQDSNDSFKEMLLSMFDCTSDFLGDSLWTNIYEFFIKIASLYAATVDAVSFEALDLDTILKQSRIFRKQLPAVKDLLEMGFLAYEFVLGNWEKIRTGDWSILLLGKDETQEFEVEVRLLEQAFTLVIARKEIELQTNYGLTLKTYESRLTAAIKKAKTLISRCTSVQQKMSVSNFIKTLTEKQGQMYAMLADAPTKPEAYAVKFAGPSGSGKSTLLNLTSKIILNAYDYDPNERGQVVMTNIAEKYESTVMPHHKIIAADDVANNKNEKPNYDRILNYVNTVPRPLEKAGVTEKGTLYPGNCAFLATTNDETLQAMKCSACPESILRRFSLDVTVEIREEFRNAYGGLIKTNTPRYDVYDLTLKRFSHIHTDEETDEKTICWQIIDREIWNPNDDGTNDFAAMCLFLTEDVQRHISEVTEKAKAEQELNDCKFCTSCNCPVVVCACKSIDTQELDSLIEDDSDEQTDDTPPLDFTRASDDDDDDDSDDEEEMQEIADRLMKNHAQTQAFFGSIWSTFSTQELWDYRAALSGSTEAAKSLYRKGALYSKLWRYRNEVKSIALRSCGSIILGAIISPKLCQPILFSQLMYGVYLYQQMIQEVENELNTRTDRLSSLCGDIHEHLRSNIRKYFACGAAFMALYQGYRIIQPLLVVQDKSTYLDEAIKSFSSKIKTPKDSSKRLIIQDERDYKEGYSRITPKETSVSKTTTSSDLQYAVAKALRVVVVKTKGETYCSVNGIFVGSNIILIPAHAVPEVFPFSIETTTVPGVPTASTKDQRITEEFCMIDRSRDFALVHLPTAPASTNFAQFFPETHSQFYARATTLLWKSPSNEIWKSQQAARPNVEDIPYYGNVEKPGLIYGTRQEMTKYTLEKGKGLKVDLEFNSFSGLCGGLYLDSSKGLIYGMHVAGYADTNKGFATCITREDIVEGMKKIQSTSPCLVVHSAAEIKVNTYDTPYTLENRPPNYLREDGTQGASVVSYFGKVLKDGQEMEGRARPPYIPTPFKGIVENLGERKHRPPKQPNDIAKGMKTLNKLTNPVQHYEADLLLKATNDYKEETLKCVREHKEELKDVLRTYSQEEAMDGIGEFGLGGLPNSTSAGFPINKTKKDCLVRDPMNEAEVKVPREFNDRFPIQEEIDRTLKAWDEGYRSEAIYKASSKVNELLPEKKAREKVRKFYGSGFANFVASRRALAGVPRFMRKFWKETECLVGINPTSREWNDFYQHLADYNSTEGLAGDFAGFDTRMSAQVTGAAAKIMLSWYEEMGCSDEDLRMISGALSDIINPNIIFDSDLYRFANGNPSGNLITVQLNSICNSIMMRYVYYSMMPNIKQSFASNIRLGTYGDDNAMTVKKHCKWFNHTACQEEFAKLDISYTMADKDAKSVAYIPLSEISFLKRLFVKHETLDIIVAPIEEDSINKKFHWIKKPNETPLSPPEQFGAYTDGAFREVYLKGKTAYEEFTRKIQNIVDLNPDLRGQVAFIPYVEMTQILKPDYEPEYVNDNTKLFAESCFGRLEDEPTPIEEEEIVKNDDLKIIAQFIEVQKSKKVNSFSPFLLFCRLVLTSVFIGFVSNEFQTWWFNDKGREKTARKLADIIKVFESKGNQTIEAFLEQYKLNGAAGIAEEFNLPYFVAVPISKIIGLCDS